MKLLIDMNLSRKWVKALATAGIDSIHWSQLGDPLASDFEICRLARQDARFIIITSDLDFGTMLARERALSPSVIQLRGQENRPEFMLMQVLSAIEKNLASLQRGAIVTITDERIRCSLLPL